MTSLASQIMERLDSGDTLARADLRLAADYDSVGRALRQLLADKKITRVGRGQYRKLRAGEQQAARYTIAKSIATKIDQSKSNVFLRSDFTDLGSYDAVGRALKKQTEDGKLMQIGYGLYAKAQTSPFTGRPAPLVGIKRLATEALKRLGIQVSPSSFEQAYNQGRSTQVPTGRTLTVTDRVRRRIGYDGNYVVLERTR